QLSGGQRQRVAMGRALVRDPRAFLLYEPLSNLDAKLRVDMRTEIKRLHQRLKTTIVYVTHDQIEAMTLATKIAVLKDGILQQSGTPAEIYTQPANMFVADFMGSPAMNLLASEVQVADGKISLAIARSQGAPLRIELPAGLLAARNGQKVVFGIRPEAITDPDSADRLSRHIVEADCQIDVVEPAGADTYAVTHLGGKEAVVRLRADTKIQAGETIRLAFNLDKAVFFDPQTERRITA
ncbi:MAG: TOBE domain-containing protein, partial [Alphaproteobacteria bacterium]|nr:TOBE domain-containing protein [Alphaproteobacteria bacterium]